MARKTRIFNPPQEDQQKDNFTVFNPQPVIPAPSAAQQLAGGGEPGQNRKIISDQIVLQESTGDLLATETEEEKIYYRTHRAVREILSIPLANGVATELGWAANVRPVQVLIINDHATDSFYVEPNGLKEATIPPTNNEGARVFEVKAGDVSALSGLHLVPTPKAKSMLDSKGFSRGWAFSLRFTSAITGRIVLFFPERANLISVPV